MVRVYCVLAGPEFNVPAESHKLNPKLNAWFSSIVGSLWEEVRRNPFPVIADTNPSASLPALENGTVSDITPAFTDQPVILDNDSPVPDGQVLDYIDVMSDVDGENENAFENCAALGNLLNACPCQHIA